jgi:hypothetical protein
MSQSANQLCKFYTQDLFIISTVDQYHNFLMRALVSNANIMSQRALDDQIVNVGSRRYHIIQNGEVSELLYNASPIDIKDEVENLPI